MIIIEVVHRTEGRTGKMVNGGRGEGMIRNSRGGENVFISY